MVEEKYVSTHTYAWRWRHNIATVVGCEQLANLGKEFMGALYTIFIFVIF